MPEAIRVLLAEDRASDAELLVRELKRAGFDPAWQRVETEEAYLEALTPDLDVILSDYSMPQFDGTRALRLLLERGLDVPFILVSGTVGEDIAVAAMKEGASDYLIKDRLQRLGSAVRHAIDERRERQERRRVEAQLHENVRLLIDQAPISMAMFDRDMRYLAASQRWIEEYGKGHSELVGRSHYDVHPDLPEVWKDVHRRGQAGEVVKNDEDLWPQADGRRLWIRWAVHPWRNAQGEIGGIIISTEDITARKEASRWQVMQHAVTRVLAESTSLTAAAPEIIQAVCESLDGRFGAIWEIDPQQNVLRCAEAWHEPGFEADKLQAQTRRTTFALGVGLPGRVWQSGAPCIVPDIAADPGFLRAEAATRAGLRGAFGFPILLRGEVVGVIDSLGSELQPPDTDVLGVLSALGSQIGQFIEHRRADQQLLQAQKMEAIGLLAGGIAHDFNNLLGVILGYGELLGRELGDAHPSQRRVEAIRKATERAAALTRQILTFSRRHAVEVQVCDLNHIALDMETMLRRLLGEDVELRVGLGDDLGRVRADPGQLEQVIMNLAVNARDAMPSGGRLVIETSNIVLDETYTASHPEVHPGPYVRLAVGDTGSGMDAATVARIFEPFFTTKELGKGTGLGLAVVFGIVKQGGGSLSVDSEPGRGSTFNVYLPRVDDVASAPADVVVDRALGGSETVLVVEDEDALRAIVVETLREAGYTVLEAQDAGSATARVAESTTPIQLVLTDVVLPGERGPELAIHLQAAQPGLRILLMSGYADQLAGKASGTGTPFLGKPFTIEALLSKVRAVLDEP
jgi:PAS domain S-box-containing protein